MVGQSRALSWGCKLSHIMQHAAPQWCFNRRAPIEGDVATYSAVGGPEAADLLLGTVELVLGGKRLQDLDNVVPELLVVLVKQDNNASRLRVER